MSPSLRIIRWRLIWTSLLALGFALGFFYLNQWVYSYSDDQCFWKVQGNKVLIVEILPNGVAEDAGLLEGDQLLAIQGFKVNPRTRNAAQALINRQSEGRILAYTVSRFDPETKEQRILVTPVRLVKPFNWVTFSVMITGLVAWAIGLLVVVSSPQRKIARHFFYLGLLALLLPLEVRGGMVGNLPIYFEIPRLLLSGALLSMGAPLWLHFFLRFPHPFPLRTHRQFLTGLYGGFLVLGLLSTGFAILRVPYGDEVMGEFFRLISVFFGRAWKGATVLAVLGGLVCFAWGSLRLPDRRRRALLPALLLSLALFADLAVYGRLLMLEADKSQMFRREAWVFFSPLPLLPLSFAYAILRHGLFDVRRALFRWLVYFLVLGLTLAIYVWGLAWLFTQSTQFLSPAWVGTFMALSVPPIAWLLRWLLQALRKAFRRDLATAREQILTNLRETKKRFSEQALLTGLEESLRDAFRPQTLLVLPVIDRKVVLPPVSVWHLVEGGTVPMELEHANQPCPLSLPPSLVRHARDNRELVLGLGSDESAWVREQGPRVRVHVDLLEAQVLMLILVNEEPHTAVLLGGKYAELNYGREDRELLREIAQAAGILLETAVLHARILDQGRLEQELQTARLLQKSLVTTEAPAVPGFQMALRLEPALETGGDLLWVKRRGENRWIAAVGDVSGKGLAAALYMSQAMALLKFATQQGNLELEGILPAMDQTLRNLMGARDFLTLCLVEWDDSGRYRIARAGHPPALLLRGSGPEEAVEVKGGGRGLGLRPASSTPWEIQEGILNPKEWLVLYSDGLTESMNREGELFGLSRFRGTLQRMWALGSVRAACESVFREVAAFETQNRDDRTLFILGRDPA